MYVVFIAPAYPSDMPLFTRGLAAVGARVLGVADVPEHDLPPLTREHLTAYLQVPSLQDEDAVVEAVRRWTSPIKVERVECLWEPGVLLAAKLREALGATGMTLEQAIPFRDKDRMKHVLSAAGIRTPRHERVRSAEECRAAAERIGFPLILKPIAGAGSADTYRVNDVAQMEAAWARMDHVGHVNLEEFIEAEEYTFDAICAGGDIAYYSISVYNPRPLIARTLEWVSPETYFLRDPDADHLAGGRAMGRAVLSALGFHAGFTHMEWYRKADGEVVFGEIGARVHGGRGADGMNYASDIDLFTGWAEAVVHGRFTQQVERRYNSAIIYKRAHGEGRIQRIEGMDALYARYGESIVYSELLPIGHPRRNWLQTLLSDGWVVVRHPDLDKTREIANAVSTDLRLYAG